MYQKPFPLVVFISFIIFAIGFGLSLFILPSLPMSVIPEFIFAFIIAITVYALFDRLIWQLPIWRRIGIVSVPVLKGDWIGTLTTSFDNRSNVYPITVQINQTWREVQVRLKSKTSESVSLTATIQRYNETDYQLSYIYLTNPRANVTDTGIVKHTGLCNLLYNSQAEELTGHYHYYYEETPERPFIHGHIVVKRV